jgi:hypothetical protein
LTQSVCSGEPSGAIATTTYRALSYCLDAGLTTLGEGLTGTVQTARTAGGAATRGTARSYATRTNAEVAPRAPAAASGLDAKFAAGAVTVPVALVACWTRLVLEADASLRAAYSRGAEAVDATAAAGFRTPPVVDGRPTRTPPLCAGHAREQGEQPTAKQSGASELKRPTPRDGARSKPFSHLVKAIDDSLLCEAKFFRTSIARHRLLLLTRVL